MKKYFAFLFSFLFTLVSVFSFTSFGSVHAQEFTKTVQFTKFPFSIEYKLNSGNTAIVSFSSSTDSVRYSFSLYDEHLYVVFFSSSPFTIYQNVDGFQTTINKL